MKKGFSQRKALYRMIRSLDDAGLQKAVSYVSFLRFSDDDKNKNILESWKAEPTVRPSVPFENENSVHAVEPPSFPVAEPFVYDEAFWHDPSQNEVSQAELSRPEVPRFDVSQIETYQPEDFYLPVRSERFEQLKKMPESDLAQQVQEPDLSLRLPESESFGTSFPVEKTQTRQEALLSAQPEPSAEPKDSGRNAYEVPVGRLKHALRVLGLSLSDLTSLFDLSFPEVCAWFEGGTLDMEQEALLQYCAKVADLVEKNGIPRFNRVAARPFSDGEYFTDKLKRQKVTGEDLKILKETAYRTEELRRKTKGSAKPFYAFQDTITLYSTPLYSEAK